MLLFVATKTPHLCNMSRYDDISLFRDLLEKSAQYLLEPRARSDRPREVQAGHTGWRIERQRNDSSHQRCWPIHSQPEYKTSPSVPKDRLDNHGSGWRARETMPFMCGTAVAAKV